MPDVAAWCGLPENAEAWKIDKAIYKGTSCGASIRFTETGVMLHTIVEGSDAEFQRDYTPGPDYTRQHFHEWIGHALAELEELANDAWNEANN